MGSTDDWGASNPWYQSQAFGDANATFIEDNTFTNTTGGNPGNGSVDANAAARFVFRYNTLVGEYIGTHGFDSGGWRSAMSWEIYNNNFSINTTWYTVFNSRGGTGLMFNNTVTGSFNGFALLQNFRSDPTYSTQWGLCDGKNTYDGNTDSTGYPCLDQNGRSTGSAATPMNDTQILSPNYSWNNKMNGVDVGFGADTASQNVIKANRDYYNDTPKPGYTPFTYPFPLTAAGLPNPGGTTPTPTPTPVSTPHPADTNADYKITVNEATTYGACWRSAPAIPTGCPATGATLDNSVRAGTIWNSSSDGSYHYDSTKTCPLCWVP
jgi:hypothetical protein